MPRNHTTGTYTAPSNSWNPAVDGTVVDASDWIAQLADYADAWTDSLSRSGYGGMSADLAMGAHGVVITEQTSVSSPAANTVILYGKDVAGQTHVFGKTENGTDIDIMASAGIGGTTGSSDNRILRADGTGGATIQSSAVTIDDSGNVSGVGTLANGNQTITGTLAVSGAMTNGGNTVLNGGASGVAGQTIVSGYILTCFNHGNKAFGTTISPEPSLGQHQKAVLTSVAAAGTAVAIAPPTVEGDCILKILNTTGSTAVATPTFVGFDKQLTGDTFNTADTKINWIFIFNVDGLQAYQIKNMN